MSKKRKTRKAGESPDFDPKEARTILKIRSEPFDFENEPMSWIFSMPEVKPGTIVQLNIYSFPGSMIDIRKAISLVQLVQLDHPDMASVAGNPKTVEEKKL